MLESLQNNTFTYEKLTEEEQTKRGILGRLVGIIADGKNPTRNGRLYSSELWEKVFEDPIMQEKIANRCCFGELGHPAEREEIDPEKIAICLAEKPKMGKDGCLYGVFDILSTPNGKILKTLCDYGCKIGVSSRGSGDVMANDEVDPDTYFCECWDAVVIPAVKQARMQYVTESLDTNKLKLRKALTESYEAANDEDKKVMKETLENLDLKLDEAGGLNDADIVYEDPEAPDNMLTEEEVTEEPVEESPEEEVEETTEEPAIEAEITEEPVIEEKPADMPVEEVIETVAEVADEIKEIVEADEDEVEAIDEVVEEKKEELLPEEESIPEEGGDKEEVEEPELEVDEISVNGEEESEEAEDAEEEVIDDEADEVLESLKEMIRQKEGLEAEVKSLKKDKTVSDAEVATLKEELNKYKAAFTRTSVLAAKSKDLEKEVQTLQESLTARDITIAKLNEEKDKTVKLNESINEDARKVKTLTENLNALRKELDTAESRSKVVVEKYKAKLEESVNAANKYKAKFNLVLEHYIKSKATMLGVRPTDITSRLNESYTLTDIDEVCDTILTEGTYLSSLPYGFSGASVKQQVTKPAKAYIDPDDGYEIDDSLYDLAGLKR